MRTFRITYTKINKHNNGILRNSTISVSNPTGDIGRDAHSALNLFVSSIGGLKKYDVLEIQELNDEGNPIGEPIKPMGDSSIVPYRK